MMIYKGISTSWLSTHILVPFWLHKASSSREMGFESLWLSRLDGFGGVVIVGIQVQVYLFTLFNCDLLNVTFAMKYRIYLYELYWHVLEKYFADLFLSIKFLRPTSIMNHRFDISTYIYMSKMYCFYIMNVIYFVEYLYRSRRKCL